MKILTLASCLILQFLLAGCSENERRKQNNRAGDNYKIEDGFTMELVASDPLIQAPVAIDFDNTGRIWVVEMRGYMPNVNGIGEEEKNGRITILENPDENGVMESAKVFMDSLVLPRAIAHVYGGLLYIEPPNLWFVEIRDDRPINRVLVDSLFAIGGYVEMQPNGLMMNVDNWIYSANSNWRYQRRNGEWIKEPTPFRGQWGISKDDAGRLYYNYNELQLAGDYLLPAAMVDNRFLKPAESLNKSLTDNQRIYALHPTTVNRGYKPGILGSDSTLQRFTAACGPVIYTGDQFPKEYYQNAFVCEPQANLIKRNLLSFDSIQTRASQAWNNKEFVASTDEGFRPVNLFNAPDGTMYVVDMHRGVLEHRAVSSPYYRKQIIAKHLDTLLHSGKIFRVRHKGKEPTVVPDFDKATAAELLKLLTSKNGWVRDRAQQTIIFRGEKTLVPQLKSLVQNSGNEIGAIHALHTLEGLNELTFEILRESAISEYPLVTAHSLLLLKDYASADRIALMASMADTLLQRQNDVIDLYVAASLAPWTRISPKTFFPVLQRLASRYRGDKIYEEAIVNGLEGLEEQFAKAGLKSASLQSLLIETAGNKRNNVMNPIYVAGTVLSDERATGLNLYRSTCAGCHGMDGEGIDHVAPPLRGSEYVTGSPDTLAMIILNGLEGPIRVNGKDYNFSGAMPEFRNNFNDQQIADIVHYLRNSYAQDAEKHISAERVNELRTGKVARSSR